MTDDDLKSLALDFRDQMVGIDLLRAVFQAGAASRNAEIAGLKTVPMRYRRMAFNAQLQDEVARLEQENDQLRAELVKALAACKVKDEAILQENYSLALSFQPDDSALKAWLGEPECFYDGYKFYSNEMSAACGMANLANLRPLYSPKGLK